MTFDELCDAVRRYIQALPTERRDDWRNVLDDTLASIRAELSSR